MTHDIALRCRCGTVRGLARDVTRDNGTRGVCYCDDCQAYARYLGSADLLNAFGGSDLYQTMPKRVSFDAGEQLRCVRLSEKGMHRWYVACCRTPVGNTFGAKMPFVGIPVAFWDRAALDAATGEPIAHVQGKFARGDVPAYVHQTWPASLLGRGFRLLGGWALARGWKPSPYFDERGRPRATVQTLAPEERRALA
ncbi:MAG: DUF6151 family protein [Polyangiales bacterium]